MLSVQLEPSLSTSTVEPAPRQVRSGMSLRVGSKSGTLETQLRVPQDGPGCHAPAGSVVRPKPPGPARGRGSLQVGAERAPRFGLGIRVG